MTCQGDFWKNTKKSPRRGFKLNLFWNYLDTVIRFFVWFTIVYVCN